MVQNCSYKLAYLPKSGKLRCISDTAGSDRGLADEVSDGVVDGVVTDRGNHECGAPTALSEALIESIAMFRFSKTPVTLLSASIQLSASTFNVNLLMMFPPFHSLPLLKAASLPQ